MSAEGESARRGFKWPVCTLIIVALLAGLGYWGYARFQAERAGAPIAAGTPAAGESRAAPVPPAVYRSALPTYLIAGFAAVMAALLGTIIYLWWSLKDLEGGKRYGEGEEKPSGEAGPPPGRREP